MKILLLGDGSYGSLSKMKFPVEIHAESIHESTCGRHQYVVVDRKTLILHGVDSPAIPQYNFVVGEDCELV